MIVRFQREDCEVEGTARYGEMEITFNPKNTSGYR
jgi:hypothetical protein